MLQTLILLSLEDSLAVVASASVEADLVLVVLNLPHWTKEAMLNQKNLMKLMKKTVHLKVSQALEDLGIPLANQEVVALVPLPDLEVVASLEVRPLLNLLDNLPLP